ncbi:HD domain-containing protein [Candidatus Bipolaricaulota bacterium]|nr:HD domain-containing protein [Candidatus Bipolaricaulota bacterium]
MSFKTKSFFWLVVISGIVSGYLYFPRLDYLTGNLALILPLVAFALFSEIYEIDILPRHAVSVSTAINLGAIYIGGFPLAFAVALPEIFISEAIMRGMDLRDGIPVSLCLERIAFNTAQVLLSVTSAALIFELIGGHAPPFPTIFGYIPPFVAFFVYTFLNISLVSGIVSLAEGENFLYQLKFSLRNLHVQVLSLGVLSILIAVAYKSSPWNLLLVAVLLFLVNSSLRSYVRLRKQAKQTFEKIMDLLSKRDPYTHEHSESVGSLTEAIADQMKVNPDKKEDIVSAARVHDIGKLGIPDEVLLKKGSLNEEEWETMKEHPVLGADILSGLIIYEDSVDVVRHEHERWDGSGYPDGLSGEDIPLGSRIVAVADVWNALTTQRPYRGPMSEDEAREEIKDMAGVKLDQKVVNALLEVLDSDREIGTG